MILSSPDPAADPYLAAALLRLQRTSYAMEAALIGDDRIPPLQEDEIGLTAWRGRWVTAWDGVRLVGAIAWWESVDVVEIQKVMVSPSAMRRGIASTLLGRVLEAASSRPVVAATGRANAPAVSLYGKHGFRAQGDEQVPPGIWITRFRHAA
ncbi:GNAT family N-acetyltransferase [Aeromicrobium sp. A1-2]|uniref:GNAT family N-acetyltransferase n=1 Tax=Aeromicrobium sp. A1-2 TaxID=2107713 RepID=UPI000E4B6FB7|nr:GNAT family N-acetyltransferase [Aeromicrobium sp. A1-2]AXT85821.1 GNAT family N-acetyltransferase [Aeromicrobium sp. A1-2]